MAFVHLYDSAGDHLADNAMADSLAYLRTSQGLIFVLDPIGIPTLFKKLAVSDPRHTRIGGAHQHPEVAYQEVLNRVRDAGVSPKDQSLALVVSKCDILEAFGIDVPTDPAGVSAWLTEQGLGNFMTGVLRDFRKVNWFTTGSTASKDVTRDAGQPLLWLLGSVGLRRAQRAAALRTGSAA